MMDFIKDIKKITVLGAGISGMEVAKWAVSMGKDVIISDSKPINRFNGEFLEFCRKNNVIVEANGHTFESIRGSHLLVVSPGISPQSEVIQFAMENTIPIVGEIDLAMRLWKGKVIGITGTNGKTTTTSLTGHIFSCADITTVVAGNIGKPLISFVSDGNLNNENAVAVLEVSSFQLDYFSQTKEMGIPLFSHAAITNITPDHLDRYKTFQNYKQSKFRLLEFIEKDSYLVVNMDLMEENNIKSNKILKIVPFGLNIDNNFQFYSTVSENRLKIRLLDRYIDLILSRWSLKGGHNLENLCCAATLAFSFGIHEGAIQKAIDTFKAPRHRLQYVDTVDGVEFYNDSKATNVSSVIKALDAMSKPVIIILGGRGKGESYEPLREYARSNKIKGAILIGEEGKNIGDVIKNYIPVTFIQNGVSGFDAMQKAVFSAKEMARDGDVVLLSPACASFDMFNNYEERGEAFIKSVEKIKEEYGG